MSKKLNIKQQKFVDKYMEIWNATQAYKEVYGVAQNSAEKSWPRLLDNVGVREEIERRRNKLEKKAEENEFDVLKWYINVYKKCTQQEKIKKVIKLWEEYKELEVTWDFDASGANSALQWAGKILGSFEKDNDQKNKLKLTVELTDKQREAINSLKNFLQ